jgi:DNA-binding response OmpR family regulator
MGEKQFMVNRDTPPNIMVVDDQPANLKLMEDMLKLQGYSVRSFPRGRMALEAASKDLPDLILLDINMPEMNGFEVCERLKADRRLASIPVIFLSALTDTEDKVKAFGSGGVDYVTKPFQFEEVQARVETHIQLQRARRAERDLLENTLNGAIRTLAELVHMTGRTLSARAEAIRAVVAHLATALAVEERWQYDLAATLCLIGCVSLPVDVFERAYTGETLSAEEAQMFRAHPESGARLLANIPRLENVAEMIRHQQTIGRDASDGISQRGASMLRIALEIERVRPKAVSWKAALMQVRDVLRGFPAEMLLALEDYAPPKASFDIRRLHVHELRALMILEEDVLTKDGNLMISLKGTTLNATLIERIGNFAKSRGIGQQPIPVRVIRPEGTPYLK